MQTKREARDVVAERNWERVSSYRDAFIKDGAVLVPNALEPAEMKLLEEAFQFKLDNAGAGTMRFYEGQFIQALGGHEAAEPFQRALRDTSIADVAAALFGSGPVWFVEEQIFYKKAPPDEPARRTPWHQDASYQPFNGTKNVVLWVSFDSLTKEEALEVVLGSHSGPLYNGVGNDDVDDTKPVFPEHLLPRVPNIEADRSSWNIASWAYQPGDVLAFHPRTLHGGGLCLPGKSRRSLALRMFGDDCVRVEHAGLIDRGEGRSEKQYLGRFAALALGEHASNAVGVTVRPWVERPKRL